MPMPRVDVPPTGWAVLGIGGWPRGRICGVFGPEGVGVTSLLLHAVAAAQERRAIDEDILSARPEDGPWR
jgi:hypothetical protein